EPAAGPQVLRAAAEGAVRGEPAGVDEVRARLALDDADEGVVLHLGEQLEALRLEHGPGLLHARLFNLVVELLGEGVEVECAGLGWRGRGGRAGPRAGALPLQPYGWYEAGREDGRFVEPGPHELDAVKGCIAEVRATEVRKREIRIREIGFLEVAA